MSRESVEKEQLGGSPIRGVLLGILLERGQPLHGYMLTTLVERRLGAEWGVTRQSIYRMLGVLERQGLVFSQARSAGAGRAKKVYCPTSDANVAFEEWMAQPVSRQPVRAELQAKIAAARPQHAAYLLRALETYERECFAVMGKCNEADVPMESWSGLMLNLARTAVDEHIQAELRWLSVARGWIRDFLEEHPHFSAR